MKWVILKNKQKPLTWAQLGWWLVVGEQDLPDCSGALLMVNGCHSYLAMTGMLM